MNPQTRAGLVLLGTSIATGSINNFLLKDSFIKMSPFGFNVFIATFVTLTAFLWWWRWQGKAVSRASLAFFLLALPFAAAVGWRDNVTMKTIDFLSIGLCVSAGISSMCGLRMHLAGVVDHLVSVFLTATLAICSPLELLLKRIGWGEVFGKDSSLYLRAVVRGFAVAVPLFLVFLSLFVSADAAFDRAVQNVFSFSMWDWVTTLFFTLGCGWLFAGIGFATTNSGAQSLKTVEMNSPGVGTTELSIVLGSLNALFLSFVCFQWRYLFGGPELIKQVTGLTVAEYARRGFFELVAVGALAVLILLGADFVRAKHTALQKRLFALLASSQIAMLFVMIVSALQRMYLYQSEFGLTELRVYTTAFMGWISLLLVSFALLIFTDRRRYFAVTALVCGLGIAGTLNAINPDALIAHVNIQRAVAGHEVDMSYLCSLSADSVPAIVANIEKFNGRIGTGLSNELLRAYPYDEEVDWRNWSWAHKEAYTAVQHRRKALEQIAAKS